MTVKAIPGVKEQVRRWSASRPKPDAEPQRETFDYRQLKILGRVGRSTFASLGDGREVRLRGPVPPFRIEEQADALVITRPRRADGHVVVDSFLATEVDRGTYRRLSRRKTYRGPKETPAGPVDAHAEMRRGSGREAVPLGPDDGSPEAVIIGALSRKPTLLFTDGDQPLVTIAALVDAVNARRGNLRHHRGNTLADWTKVNGRLRTLLVALWPLVDAHVAGTPLRCAFEHEHAPVADTLDLVGTPTCNGHVGLGALVP